MNRAIVQTSSWFLLCLVATVMQVGCTQDDPPASSSSSTSTTASHSEIHPPRETEEPEFEGPPLTEFTLTDSGGSQFRSENLDGRVWVASFFFTRCASNCRALNMKISELQREYGPRGVQMVSISCDPEYDTPPVLTSYAEMFNAQPDQWEFLTGDFKYIQRVGHDIFDVSVGEKMHDDQLLVVDRRGEIRGKFHVRQPEQYERMTRLLDKLLAETGGEGDDPAADAGEDPQPSEAPEV